MRSSSRRSATTSSAPAATTSASRTTPPATRSPATGAISFSTAAFGYSFLVNTSQSKPMLGSAAEPQLDLSFAVTFDRHRRQRLHLHLGHRLHARFRVGAAHPRRHQLGRERNRHRPRLGRHEQYRAAVLGRQPHRLARRPDRPDIRQAARPARSRRSSSPYSLTIGMQITRASAGTSSGNLIPAGLGDSRAEHLGVDLHGSGPGRLRLAPAPSALGFTPAQKPASAGFVVDGGRPRAQSGVLRGANFGGRRFALIFS